MRFTDSQLRDKALYALGEAFEQCRDGSAVKSEALRFALAYLANGAKERWPFDQFWKAVSTPAEGTKAQQFGRFQELNASLNGIYVQLGLTRG